MGGGLCQIAQIFAAYTNTVKLDVGVKFVLD